MKKLERKQIILLTLILLALIYIVWQIYDLFGGDLFGSSSTPVAVAPQLKKAEADSKAVDESHAVSKEIQATDKELQVDPRSQQLTGLQTTNSNGRVNQSATAPGVNSASQVVPLNTNNQQPASNNAPSNPTAPQNTQSINKAPVPSTQQRPVTSPASAAPAAETMPMPMLSAQQQQYLNLLNQYQMLRMQRQIVNEKAAIMAAEEKIAEVSQKAGSINQASYTEDFSASQSGSYKLIYVDNQSGQWTATLNRAGQYYEVVAGDILPDGTRIMRVSRSGVNMIYQNQPYVLSFYGMAADTEKAAPAESDQPSARELLVPQMNLPPANNSNSPNLNNTPVESSPANSAAPVQPDTINPNGSVNEPASGSSVTNKPLGLREEPVKPSIPLTKKQNQELAVMKNSMGEAGIAPQEMAQIKPQAVENQAKKPLEIKPLLAEPKAVAEAQNVSENKTQSSNTKYTIQLIASLNKADVSAFMTANKLEKTARIVPIQRENKTWYLLVYGDYAQMKDAEAAMEKLPKSLKTNHPWVRAQAQLASQAAG